MPRQAGWEVGRVPGFYQGAGVPSASTLVAGDYQVGDYYINTSANTLYICSTAGSASTSVWTQVGAAAAAPTLVAKKGSQSGTDYTTTTATYTDVDATNLAVTTSIAVGSKCTVTATGPVQINALASGFIRLLDGTTTIAEAFVGGQNATAEPTNYTMRAIIAGDGASHTIKLQFAVNGANTLTLANRAFSTTTTPANGAQSLDTRVETAS